MQRNGLIQNVLMHKVLRNNAVFRSQGHRIKAARGKILLGEIKIKITMLEEKNTFIEWKNIVCLHDLY